MSTAAPPPGSTDLSEEPKPVRRIDHLVVYGHSNILYWWPVWLVSFILAAITWAEGQQMAAIPRGSEFVADRTVEGVPGRHDVIVAPEGAKFSEGAEGAPDSGAMTVSTNNSLGVVFVATLLVVAIASTILLRGLVSLVAMVAMIALIIALALFKLWNDILLFLGGLDIRMNAAGYLAVGIPLFIVWVVVIFVYDRAHYILFDQGQIRYVQEVGDAEIAHQTEGAIVEKKRNDVFRHWLLGFGTGDLLIRVGGTNGPTIELENVIAINSKLGLIQRLIKEKAITVDEGTPV